MKKKIGTVMESALLYEAKTRAALEKRPLADLFQDALKVYLSKAGPRADAERSCRLFCSHGGPLGLEEIDRLLNEDVYTA